MMWLGPVSTLIYPISAGQSNAAQLCKKKPTQISGAMATGKLILHPKIPHNEA